MLYLVKRLTGRGWRDPESSLCWFVRHLRFTMHQPREVVGFDSPRVLIPGRNSIQMLYFQQNSCEILLVNLMYTHIYCHSNNSRCLISIKLWICFFPETLDLLTKNLGITSRFIHFGLQKFSNPGNSPWRFRSPKHLSLVVPVVLGRRSPRWSLEITVTMSRTLGLLQLPQLLWWFCGEDMLALRERRGIGTRANRGKPFGRCCWLVCFFGVMIWWINKSEVCAKLR